MTINYFYKHIFLHFNSEFMNTYFYRFSDLNQISHSRLFLIIRLIRSHCKQILFIHPSEFEQIKASASSKVNPLFICFCNTPSNYCNHLTSGRCKTNLFEDIEVFAFLFIIIHVLNRTQRIQSFPLTPK